MGIQVALLSVIQELLWQWSLSDVSVYCSSQRTGTERSWRSASRVYVVTGGQSQFCKCSYSVKGMDLFLKSYNQQETNGRDDFELDFGNSLFVPFVKKKERKLAEVVHLEMYSKHCACFCWLERNTLSLNIEVLFFLVWSIRVRFLKTLETWEKFPM